MNAYVRRAKNLVLCVDELLVGYFINTLELRPFRPYFGIANKMFVDLISQVSRELIGQSFSNATDSLSVESGGFDLLFPVTIGFDLLFPVTISELRRRDLYAGDSTQTAREGRVVGRTPRHSQTMVYTTAPWSPPRRIFTGEVNAMQYRLVI